MKHEPVRVYLSRQEIQALRRECRQRKICRSALLRMLLREQLGLEA